MKSNTRVAICLLAFWVAPFMIPMACLSVACFAQQDLRPVRLQSCIDSVQPMTGIVLWTDHEQVETDAISMEYRYMSYADVAQSASEYDWSVVDGLLDEIASRQHQAILRFYYVYPGKPTTVPTFIKALPDYKETQGKSEGKRTGFPDWSNTSLQQFTLDFYTRFAERYDNDPRLAFLQTGFGLWGEYHIYDGPRKIGKTFPGKDFQAKFVRHLDEVFIKMPWMISIDAADHSYSLFEEQRDLRELDFGLFDDSFLAKSHASENAENWKAFGSDRWKRSPAGGELNYYTKKDQRLALSADGPRGTSFESMANEFHITFMIGNDQPSHQSMPVIRQASMTTGYQFRVSKCEANASSALVTVVNDGIAPLYRDAFVAVDGVRSSQSLRLLCNGESREFRITSDDGFSNPSRPTLTIESDHLVAGQQLQFNADLNESSSP